MGLYLRKPNGTYVRVDDGEGEIKSIDSEELMFVDPYFGFKYLDYVTKNSISIPGMAVRLDEFDTLDTNYWTHIEGTEVEVSEKAKYSGNYGLRLYYSDGEPWHADVGHTFKTKRNKVIVKVWWRNTSDDDQDPDRGGLYISEEIVKPHTDEKGVASITVYPNYIALGVGGKGVVKKIPGSWSNVWVELGILINEKNIVYFYVNGQIYGPYVTAYTAGCVKLGMAGYHHEEHADVFRIVEPTQ